MLDLTNRKPRKELDKLPKPSNDNLNKLFVGVDKIIIKDNRVYQDRAMSDRILLTICDPDNICTFKELIEIDEKNTGFYCMCLGTYAIELYAGAQIKATIGFHHGVSIRYSQWNGDAALSKIDELLLFLSELGFTEPLSDRIKEKREMEPDRIAERKWLEKAPKSFQKHWSQIQSADKSFFNALTKDLDSEFPEKNKQIVALLQAFGRTDNLWLAYPNYENLPNEILGTFQVKDIITSYLSSDRNYKTRKGLGRFLCSSEFKKIRSQHISEIPVEVIDELEKCFRWLAEPEGIKEILNLKAEKALK